jgi:peptide deformylase
MKKKKGVSQRETARYHINRKNKIKRKSEEKEKEEGCFQGEKVPELIYVKKTIIKKKSEEKIKKEGCFSREDGVLN